MPHSWNTILTKTPPEYLSDMLIPPEQSIEKTVWPLSLLALRKVIERLGISRQPLQFSSEFSVNILRIRSKNVQIHKKSTFSLLLNKKQEQSPQKPHQNDSNNNPKSNFSCLTHPKIQTILMKKNIKQKKRHEIERMSQLTAQIAKKLGVNYIVDFGSGLGHLARLLAYGYKLNVCCLERETAFTNQAK